MNSPFTSNYHPDSQALMGYAEGLVDRQASLNTEVASHLKTCETCQVQVQEIRNSLRVINAVDDVEALADLTASILLAAKQAPRQSHDIHTWLRHSALAASFLIVATLALGLIADRQPVSAPTQKAALQEAFQAESTEAVQTLTANHTPIPQSTPAEDLIAPAVLGSHRSPNTKLERAQYRALDAYFDDIAEARQALANNPGLVRASNTILATQVIRDETLAAIYMEESY